jgi:hypothetical protein
MVISGYFFGIILVCVVTSLSILGLLIVRRQVGVETLTSWHDVAGYLLSVVGTMYAVLLGLIVVDAMTKFQNARFITEQEANNLADVFLLADHMPDPYKHNVQKMCVDYCEAVITRDWPKMEKQDNSFEARHLAIKLVRVLENYEPQTESEKAIYPMILTEGLSLWDNRRARIITATNGIPAVEWFVVIIGGIVTTIFTYFFGLTQLRSQIVMTALVAILISLNVYLVLLFGYPFAGDLKVMPEAFEVDRTIFLRQIGV